MAILSSLALLIASQTSPTIGMFTAELQTMCLNGDSASLRTAFLHPDDSKYLLKMAAGSALRTIGVRTIASPPGWSTDGDYWVVFFKPQEIEQDRDVVVPAKMVGGRWRLGAVIPEWGPDPYRIKHVEAEVKIEHPENHSAVIESDVELTRTGKPRPIVFRLNEFYVLMQADVDGKAWEIVRSETLQGAPPKEGSVIRAGSLIIVWTNKPVEKIKFGYSGLVQMPNHDKVTEDVSYITAWWVPTIGRLPHTTEVSVECPKDWIARSEGVQVGKVEPADEPGLSKWRFRCDLPISYPKVIAGKYVLAAERKSGGKTFRAWHLKTANTVRGQRDVDIIDRAVAFYQKNLVPLPFPSYEVFDADTYYGIESYSYTLLQKEYTSTFVAHELGHTYFGGIAPSAYTRDTWNEGMTQYIDSVCFRNNSDRSLEAGYRLRSLKVPLSKMDIAWDNGSATYYRGAYAMNMLALEIGQERVYAGLRGMLKDRVGKDTLWGDLRPYFEKASGKKLEWFWKQWIDGSEFPALKITAQKPVVGGMNVTVEQIGIGRPFTLMFGLKGSNSKDTKPMIVRLTKQTETFKVPSSQAGDKVEIVAYPYTLCSVSRDN